MKDFITINDNKVEYSRQGTEMVEGEIENVDKSRN
jgi:hypothetical protein